MEIKDKFRFIIVLLLLSAQCFSQDNAAIYCYSKNEDNNLKLYKSESDKVAAHTLPSLVNEEHCWYVIELTHSKGGRFRIKSLRVMPSCRDWELPSAEGLWMDKSNDLYIDSAYYHFDRGETLTLYSGPILDSDKIVIREYTEYYFLDFKDYWALVGYYENDLFKTAWMEPAEQCYRPWTACSRNDE